MEGNETGSMGKKKLAHPSVPDEVMACLKSNDPAIRAAVKSLFGSQERREATMTMLHNMMLMAVQAPDIVETRPWHPARKYMQRTEIADYVRHAYGVRIGDVKIGKMCKQGVPSAADKNTIVKLEGFKSPNGRTTLYRKASVDLAIEALMGMEAGEENE